MSFPGASPPGTPNSNQSHSSSNQSDYDSEEEEQQHTIQAPLVTITGADGEEYNDNNFDDNDNGGHRTSSAGSSNVSSRSSYSSGSRSKMSSRGSSESRGAYSSYSDSNDEQHTTLESAFDHFDDQPQGNGMYDTDHLHDHDGHDDHHDHHHDHHRDHQNNNDDEEGVHSRMSKLSDESTQSKSHWDVLQAAILRGGHSGIQKAMIQRAHKFTAMASKIHFNYPDIAIPVDTSLPSFTNLSHPNRQHIAGHLRSHKEIVENAISRVDSQPPQRALHWTVSKTVQRLRDPLPSLQIPNTLKNHMATSTLDHIKRQHHFHDELIGNVKSRVDTHHSLHHVKAHMEKQVRRKKHNEIAKVQSLLRAQRKRRVTGGGGAGTNRGWMLESEKESPLMIKSRGGKRRPLKRDPRMMEEPYIGGLNYLAKMNGLFSWPTSEGGGPNGGGSVPGFHIAALDMRRATDNGLGGGGESDSGHSSERSRAASSQQASSRESRDHFPQTNRDLEEDLPTPGYRPMSR